MRKHRAPMTVRPVAAVPRLTVEYSRRTVPSPTSTQVSSSSILEVLRRPAEEGALADRHVGRESDVALQGGPRPDPAAIAHDDVGPDDGEGADLDALPELGAGVHERGRVDAGCHRSTTAAIISASTTTFPST